jgi:uncharacterized protein (TIGR03067 family)
MITIRKQSRGRSLLSKLLPFLFLGLLTGCAGKPPAGSALQKLQGKWHGVVVGDKSEDRYTVTIAGDSFHFQRDTNFWFETRIKLPSGTVPQQLHATIRRCAPGQENSLGKTVVAIVQVADGKLTLAARGDGGDEIPTSFEATEDKGLTVYELSKVQASTLPIQHPSPTP